MKKLKLTKRILAALLVAVLILTAAPLSGIENFDFSAKASALGTSGTCGGKVTWTFDEETGTLTISGTGDMTNYSGNTSPFYKNSDILSVVIEDGVTSVGRYLFYGCTGLVSVTIGNGVTSIGYYAFYGCTGLTGINISQSVSSIGLDAFGGCTGLTSITVDSNNQTYDSRDNCNAIIITGSNTLYFGCKILLFWTL